MRGEYPAKEDMRIAANQPAEVLYPSALCLPFRSAHLAPPPATQYAAITCGFGLFRLPLEPRLDIRYRLRATMRAGVLSITHCLTIFAEHGLRQRNEHNRFQTRFHNSLHGYRSMTSPKKKGTAGWRSLSKQPTSDYFDRFFLLVPIAFRR